MHTKLVRTPALFVIGFMGSGKTTVGSLLAEELGWNFADLDDDIEADARSTITQIFETRGEPEFRRIEHAMLAKRIRSVQFGSPTVLAVGGGAFVQPDNYNLLENNGVSIWLDCPLDLIRERIQGQLHRPLARDPILFEELYRERHAAYARADYRIEISGNDPKAPVTQILALPLF